MEYNWENKKIIIAEDSEINFIILQKNIEPYGASILWSKDGEELIGMIENEKDVDLILIDISMPKLDGYQATRILRDKGFNMPIIAQSSFIFDIEIDKIFAAGCNDYIAKPIQREELLSKINHALSSDIP